MRYKYLLLLLLPVFITACKNNPNDSAPKSRWYKRYTGIIAGSRVVANLFFDGDRAAEDGIQTVSGNYYYSKKSDLLDLEQKDINNNVIELKEHSAQDSDDDNSKHPKWLIKISDTGLSGTWISADGTKSYPIHLKENYDGAYAFDVISVQDSTKFKSTKDEYQMSTDYTLLSPKDKTSPDGRFILQELLHVLGGDSIRAKDLNEFITLSNKSDFNEYISTQNDMLKDTILAEGETNNWENSVAGTLEYNDRGLVVISLVKYNFTGGAHPNHWIEYVCLDVKGKKSLHLGDILNVDTPKLRAMLENPIRKKFEIGPGESLGTRLLVDTIPFTDNFIISETGITFYYNAYEIASYADGDSEYFISYTQLGDMLKPEFRARMHQ